MVTNLTGFGHIVITDTVLTDISVGAAVITGGVVTAEAMGGEEHIAAAVGMAGAAEAMAGVDMVGIEMKLCTKITYLIRPKWMDNNHVKVNSGSL